MTVGQFTEPVLLVPRLLSDTQASAIQELAKRLYRAERIEDADGFCAPVMERELGAPTLIGNGVAMPHARGAGVTSLSLAVGISDAGIPWPERDSMVHVVFLSAIPFSQTQTYLSLLMGLSRLVQDESAFESLKNAARTEQMIEILNSISLEQPERACQ